MSDPKVETRTAEQLTHMRNCPELSGGDYDCTCGLHWRIQHQTAMELLAAWQKRAYEAEAALAAAEQDLAGVKETREIVSSDMNEVIDALGEYLAKQPSPAAAIRIVLSRLAAAEQELAEARRLLESWIGHEGPASLQLDTRAFLAARPDGAPPQKAETLIPMALQAACGCTFHHDHKWCGSSLCECSGAPPQKAERCRHIIPCGDIGKTCSDRPPAWDGAPPQKAESLTFDTLRRVNVDRCLNGFKHTLDSWSVAEWTNAAAGEMGEACNIAKKMLRHRDGVSGNKGDDTDLAKLRGKLAREMADVVIYLDLVAASQGIDLGAVVVETFDAKSAELGAPHRLVDSAPKAEPNERHAFHAWPGDSRERIDGKCRRDGCGKSASDPVHAPAALWSDYCGLPLNPGHWCGNVKPCSVHREG